MTVRSVQKCFALLCLGTLWLLAGRAVVQHAAGRAERNFSVNREKRDPAPFPAFPELPTRQWGRAFDAFFNDRFPCRRTWIKNYHSVFVKFLRSPYAGRIPGKDEHEFYVGEIPELETYMGVCTIPDAEIDNWVTVFEGRKAWADAMGIAYLQMIVPYRAVVNEESLPFRLRRQRRPTLGERLAKAMRRSPCASSFLYPVSVLQDAKKAAGDSCYYKNDAHFSPYGTFVIYSLINAKLMESFPGIRQISLGDSSASGQAARPGCRVSGKVLEVSYPGEVNVRDDYYLENRDTGRPYPEKNVMTRRPEPGLRVLLSNDSMLRLSLDSWEKEEGHVHMPFGHGIQEVKSYLWRTMYPGLLEAIVTDYIPDIWIEEMMEDRLRPLKFGATDSLKNGAAFGRAAPVPGTTVPDRPGASLHVLAVLEHPVSEKTSRDPHELLPVTVRFSIGDECLAEETSYQGLRRAVFSPPVPVKPRHVGKPVRVEIDGKAEEIRLELRVSEGGQGAPAASP